MMRTSVLERAQAWVAKERRATAINGFRMAGLYVHLPGISPPTRSEAELRHQGAGGRIRICGSYNGEAARGTTRGNPNQKWEYSGGVPTGGLPLIRGRARRNLEWVARP